MEEKDISPQEVTQENVEIEQEPLQPISALAEENENLKKQIDSLNGQIEVLKIVATKEKSRSDELNSLAVRLQADFDNYRKRTNENSKKLKEDGIICVLEKIMPVLDVIEQALKMIDDEKVAEGVCMIERQILAMMSQFGVTEIDALNTEFDPNFHNAVARVPGKKEKADLIVEVFQKGYKLADRVIRHASVAVSM